MPGSLGTAFQGFIEIATCSSAKGEPSALLAQPVSGARTTVAHQSTNSKPEAVAMPTSPPCPERQVRAAYWYRWLGRIDNPDVDRGSWSFTVVRKALARSQAVDPVITPAAVSLGAGV